MNKKVLGIVLTVFFLAMLVIPVMATPATKIEGVTVTAEVTQTPAGLPRKTGNATFILHNHGTSTGTVTITIPTENPLEPLVLEGIWDSEWASCARPKNGVALIAGTLVWTFDDEGFEGTFEGVIHRKISLPFGPDSVYEDRLVLHGTGDFRGQTLKLSYAGTLPVIDEGCLIVPK